jgi:hypothetical protein
VISAPHLGRRPWSVRTHTKVKMLFDTCAGSFQPPLECPQTSLWAFALRLISQTNCRFNPVIRPRPTHIYQPPGHSRIIVQCDRSNTWRNRRLSFLSLNRIMTCARWTMAFVLPGLLEGWASEGWWTVNAYLQDFKVKIWTKMRLIKLVAMGRVNSVLQWRNTTNKNEEGKS